MARSLRELFGQPVEANEGALVLRTVHANNAELTRPQQFMDNKVITSRYTVANFVPKFLFEQFSRFVNLYFLYVLACSAPLRCGALRL